MIAPKVLETLQRESAFITSLIHGLKHWQTVERNGHYLANFNDADRRYCLILRIFMIVCVRTRGETKDMALEALYSP